MFHAHTSIANHFEFSVRILDAPQGGMLSLYNSDMLITEPNP